MKKKVKRQRMLIIRAEMYHLLLFDEGKEISGKNICVSQRTNSMMMINIGFST